MWCVSSVRRRVACVLIYKLYRKDPEEPTDKTDKTDNLFWLPGE